MEDSIGIALPYHFGIVSLSIGKMTGAVSIRSSHLFDRDERMKNATPAVRFANDVDQLRILIHAIAARGEGDAGCVEGARVSDLIDVVYDG